MQYIYLNLNNPKDLYIERDYKLNLWAKCFPLTQLSHTSSRTMSYKLKNAGDHRSRRMKQQLNLKTYTQDFYAETTVPKKRQKE